MDYYPTPSPNYETVSGELVLFDGPEGMSASLTVFNVSPPGAIIDTMPPY